MITEWGVSMRGRPMVVLYFGRSIPAWAGEPLWPVTGLEHVDGDPVYPRVGGGTAATATITIPIGFPAWAGDTWTPTLRRVYPRVGGGTLNLRVHSVLSPRGRGNPECELNAGNTGLSPRGRGNRSALSFSASQGSIPAWAGEPQADFFADWKRVYPRVGGGTAIEGEQDSIPGGRGNHRSRLIKAH